MGGTLNGQDPLRIFDPDTDGIAAVMGDIALADMDTADGPGFLALVPDKKFTFGFGMHYISHLDMSAPAARPSRMSVEEMVTSGAFRSRIL